MPALVKDFRVGISFGKSVVRDFRVGLTFTYNRNFDIRVPTAWSTPNRLITKDFKVPAEWGSVIPLSEPDYTAVSPLIANPPSAADYQALIPRWQSTHPNFMSMIGQCVQPFVDTIGVLNNIPAQFDLDAAVGVQLDTTGLWIGRTRYIEAPITDVYFSWDTQGLGWEQGNWQGAFDPSEGLRRLDDDTFRLLLRAKVAANNWDGSNEHMNEILEALLQTQFSSVQVYDNQNMVVTVTISGVVGVVLTAILQDGELPLKPAGVAIVYEVT